MYTTDPDLGQEWAMLELLCLGLTDPERQAMFASLLRSESLRWSELLEQALRHKMLPTLAFHALNPPLEGGIPKRLREHLRSTLNLNRYTRTLWYREAARIVATLQAAGVVVAGRKEAAFEATLYGGNGSRRLGDIDFLILPKDRDRVMTLMQELDYRIGLFDWRTNRVTTFGRAELLRYRLNPDHLPAFSFVTNDSALPVIEVDFANSLTWSRSPYDVPVEYALANVVHLPIPGSQRIFMPCLTPPYQFIDTVLHLFKEAWLELWLDLEQDVDLMKFGDVVRLWDAYRDTLVDDHFRRLIEQFDIVEPVVWVLEHLDRTLQTKIIPALGLEGRATETWLSSAKPSGGGLRTWQGTMRERLHAKDRRHLFAHENP